MTFARPALKEQFGRLHPELIVALQEFDDWSLQERLPDPVVTHVERTRDEQEAIYWPQFAASGEPETQARKDARAQFSWHLCRCAVDIRNRHYTPDELARVVDWLEKGRSAPLWEILSHDVGRGTHLHIGRRDFSWRQKWEKQNAAKNAGIVGQTPVV